MLNANIKKVTPILIASAFLIITGCGNSEKKRTKSLEESALLQASGDFANALALLEALSQSYPDDSEILQKIGLIHQELGNDPEAAFYLGAACNLAPDNPELLFQAYLAYESADQPEAAKDILEVFTKANPTAMTEALWFRLGELRAQAQQTEAALNAYLEGINLANDKPSAEIAVAIGTLFKQLDNLAQAERWLTIAAKSDDPNALPALFGLLEIHLRKKNWKAAEESIALLDKQFPGAVDASEWGNARGELKQWHEAQTAMKAQINKFAKPEPVKPSGGTTKGASDRPVATVGKAQIIIDMERAEALAEKPAGEATANETPEGQIEDQIDKPQGVGPTIVFNPNIVIKPAEPDPDFAVSFDQESQGAIVDYSIDYTTLDSTTPPPEPPAAAPQPAAEPTPAETLPETPLSFEELLARAEKAASTRDYEESIRLYWEALGRTNDRADIWNALSKVYLIDGQARNAATTALEATRLDPENIQYVLDYLRVVQRAKRPADFIKELEIAYDRFPSSPEITLSLARGYMRVKGNDYAAGILYERFIEMAPAHPLRPEAEAALTRIR